jgi:hypothetical protein
VQKNGKKIEEMPDIEAIIENRKSQAVFVPITRARDEESGSEHEPELE